MNLQEIYDSITELIEEVKNPNILATLKFTAAKADFENSNKRTYPKKILTKATEDFNSEIKKQNVTGILANLDHAQGAHPELSKGSHLITKLYMDGDLMRGEAKILNTSKGRDIMTILKSGVKPGISIKGVGNIDKKGFIKDDGAYKLFSADIVNKASFGDVTKITSADLFESANSMIKEEEKKFDVGLAEFNDLIDKTLRQSFSLSFPDANFLEKPVKECYEKFCDENWDEHAKIVEKFLLPMTVEEPKGTEKKVEGEVYTDEQQAYDEALLGGYDRDFATFEKEILPAIETSKEEENLRAEFCEYRESGGLKSWKEFKKLKEKE